MGTSKFNNKMSMGTIINQGLNQKRVNTMMVASAASAGAGAGAGAMKTNIFAYQMIDRVHTAKSGCGACGK